MILPWVSKHRTEFPAQVSYAGARAGLWRELMGLPREEEEAIRRAGVTDLMSKVLRGPWLAGTEARQKGVVECKIGQRAA